MTTINLPHAAVGLALVYVGTRMILRGLFGRRRRTP
jgi:hypothetical protein